MAYPNYPYPGYQPVPNYYPGPVPDQLAQLRQSQQMQPQVMQPPPMQSNIGPITPSGAPQNSGIIWVNSNNPVIYLRQADSTGKPSTKVYDLVERTDAPPPPQSAPQVDLSRYVTIDQLEDILAERLKRPAKAIPSKGENCLWLTIANITISS